MARRKEGWGNDTKIDKEGNLKVREWAIDSFPPLAIERDKRGKRWR